MKNLNFIKKEFLVMLLSICALTISAQNFNIQGFATLNGGTTGGAGGTVVTARSAGELQDYCSRNGKYIIYIDRTISLSSMCKVTSDKSILGVSGSAGRITGYGLNVDGAHNVIIQNLRFSGSRDDGIQVTNYSTNVWIDHCDFQSAYDGLLDIRRGSNYVTVSWNKFSNHDKVALIGSGDGDGGSDRGRLKVTYHHNWFAGTNQRHPRCRFGEVHVYNNYFDNLGSYGIASTTEARVYVENNYFLNVGRPTSLAEGSSPQGYLEFVNNTLVNSGSPATRGTTFYPPNYYSYSKESRTTVNTSCINYSGVGVIDPGTGSGGGGSTDNGIVNGTYAIVASHSGKALDVFDWGTGDGTNIVQWEYWGGGTQQFIIQPVDGIWHRITPSISTGQALDVYEISTADGANINTWSYWGGAGQQFRFQSAGTGVWRIINRNSGKCIDVDGFSQDNGANVMQWTCISGNNNQIFELINLKSAAQPMTEASDVTIYPNPANEYLNVALPDNLRQGVSARVLNSLGQVVVEEAYISGDVSRLDISNLAAGMYIVQVQKEQGVINKMFTKN